MSQNATTIIRTALAGSGVELVASCGIEAYDAKAPAPFHSSRWMTGARGLVVVGSAGTTLWRDFHAHMVAEPSRWRAEHPLDRFVQRLLARADKALAANDIAFRRFEPTLQATPRVDFMAMARLVGLGSDGPFGMLIHAEHGAWWALRGAWFVTADVDGPLQERPPCRGCSAPCIGGWRKEDGVDARLWGKDADKPIVQATVNARKRCVVGQASRYDNEQIAYHYDRLETIARLSGR